MGGEGICWKRRRRRRARCIHLREGKERRGERRGGEGRTTPSEWASEREEEEKKSERWCSCAFARKAEGGTARAEGTGPGHWATSRPSNPRHTLAPCLLLLLIRLLLLLLLLRLSASLLLLLFSHYFFLYLGSRSSRARSHPPSYSFCALSTTKTTTAAATAEASLFCTREQPLLSLSPSFSLSLLLPRLCFFGLFSFLCHPPWNSPRSLIGPPNSSEFFQGCLSPVLPTLEYVGILMIYFLGIAACFTLAKKTFVGIVKHCLYGNISFYLISSKSCFNEIKQYIISYY